MITTLRNTDTGNKGAGFIRFLFVLVVLGISGNATAEEVRYISDTQYVPLRSGQGTQYRIIHRGLPSGTLLVVGEVNPETGYTQVTTPNGTEGWILSQYLTEEEPARTRLKALLAREELLNSDPDSMRARYVKLEEDYQQLEEQLGASRSRIEQLSSELNEVRRVSASALVLDNSNRKLGEEAEVLKARLEVLEAENRRLQEDGESDAFMNGAFAVLIGAMITLLVSRLRPRQNRSSSWA